MEHPLPHASCCAGTSDSSLTAPLASRLEGESAGRSRVIGILREGYFSVEKSHHALHLMGSRLPGFTRELFDDYPDLDPEAAAALAEQLGATLPYVAEMALAATHDGGLGGCDTNLARCHPGRPERLRDSG